jgi:hypothetical protein
MDVGRVSNNPIGNVETGKYYAVEDMLTTDPSEKFGTITLQDHYNRIATEGQEYDPYTTMYVASMLALCKDHQLGMFLICNRGYSFFSGLLRLLLPNDAVNKLNRPLIREKWIAYMYRIFHLVLLIFLVA